jgi:hypothetical protein
MSLFRPRRHGNLTRYYIVSHVIVDLEFSLWEKIICEIHYLFDSRGLPHFSYSLIKSKNWPKQHRIPPIFIFEEKIDTNHDALPSQIDCIGLGCYHLERTCS